MLPLMYLQILSYLRVKEGGVKEVKPIHELWVTLYGLEVLASGKNISWASARQ